jgi:hypothetical protein
MFQVWNKQSGELVPSVEQAISIWRRTCNLEDMFGCVKEYKRHHKTNANKIMLPLHTAAQIQLLLTS